MGLIYFVSVKTAPETWNQFEVPAEVYVYIRQLEEFVKSPETSKLKELYKERFGGTNC